ncbi:VOC family protein [Natronospora cellulosivora (SeqCode)]
MTGTIFLAEKQNIYKGYRPLKGRGRRDQVVYVIPTDDVDRDYNVLKDKGIVFMGEPQTIKEWYMRCVYFRDPEGNLFEICQDGISNN